MLRGREEGGIGGNNNVIRDNNNVDQNRCFGDNNDDNDNGLPRQSFTTNSIDKTKATGTLGQRIWRSKHFIQYSSFIVLLSFPISNTTKTSSFIFKSEYKDNPL